MFQLHIWLPIQFRYIMHSLPYSCNFSPAGYISFRWPTGWFYFIHLQFDFYLNWTRCEERGMLLLLSRKSNRSCCTSRYDWKSESQEVRDPLPGVCQCPDLLLTPKGYCRYPRLSYRILDSWGRCHGRDSPACHFLSRERILLKNSRSILYCTSYVSIWCRRSQSMDFCMFVH